MDSDRVQWRKVSSKRVILYFLHRNTDPSDGQVTSLLTSCYSILPVLASSLDLDLLVGVAHQFAEEACEYRNSPPNHFAYLSPS